VEGRRLGLPLQDSLEAPAGPLLSWFREGQALHYLPLLPQHTHVHTCIHGVVQLSQAAGRLQHALAFPPHGPRRTQAGLVTTQCLRSSGHGGLSKQQHSPLTLTEHAGQGARASCPLTISLHGSGHLGEARSLLLGWGGPGPSPWGIRGQGSSLQQDQLGSKANPEGPEALALPDYCTVPLPASKATGIWAAEPGCMAKATMAQSAPSAPWQPGPHPPMREKGGICASLLLRPVQKLLVVCCASSH
jgi:hypothetical protein